MPRVGCWMFLLALLAVMTGAGVAVESPFGIIEGTWTGDAYWSVSPKRLRMTAPGDRVGREYIIPAKETLPRDEWTISFATIQYHDIAHAEVGLLVGDRADRSFEFTVQSENSRVVLNAALWRGVNFTPFTDYYVDGIAGPIHLVTMSYSAPKRRFALWLNGRPMRITQTPSAFPTGPIRFSIKLPNGLSKPFVVDIVQFQMQNKAIFTTPATQPGMAFKGWTHIRKPTAAAVPDTFTDRMRALYTTPTLSERGRAYVLSAHLLYEQATQGRISDDLWTTVDSQCGRVAAKSDRQRTGYGLDLLYPIVVASADAGQRLHADKWVDDYFNLLMSRHFRPSDHMQQMRRAALLDPDRTVTAALQQNPDARLSMILMQDIPTMASEQRAALYSGIISQDTRQLNAYAWLLPDIAQHSPLYGDCIKALLLGLQERRDTVFSQEIDVPFAFAAYRLVSTDPRTALTLAEGIRDAGIQADVYLGIALLPVAQHIPDLPARTEKALQIHIQQWKRLRNDTSPVKRYMRLAHWYLDQQRQTEALAVVTEAIPKITQDDDRGRFIDLRLISSFYKTINHPDAKAWFAQEQEAATLADEGLMDREDGWVFISATSGTVRTLVQEGNVDEAVAIIEKMDRQMLPENIANCYAIVIYALAKTDMPKALELLKRVPPVRQRNTIIQGIAPRLTLAQARALLDEVEDGPQKTAILGAMVPTLAREDLPQALALLANMPPADRRTAIYGIAATVPLESNPELLRISGESFSAYLEETKRYSRDSRFTFFNTLCEFTPATLLALEPYFAADQELYVRVMVNAVAKACGLQEDPLWQRCAAVEWTDRRNLNYWGGTAVAHAIRRYTEDQQSAP